MFFADQIKRGVRVVEGASLESLYMGNCIEGSNPFLSANKLMLPEREAFLVLRWLWNSITIFQYSTAINCTKVFKATFS